MGAFRELPTLRPLQDGKWWILVEALHYQVNGDSLTVPAGFTTDFASTPRLLWWLLPPHGRYGAAAIVHDWLYARGSERMFFGAYGLPHYRNERAARADADRIFLDAMASMGVLIGVRYAMYYAVRVFGWWAWRANARERRRGVVRVLNPIPREVRPVKPRGLEWLLAVLHGRA